MGIFDLFKSGSGEEESNSFWNILTNEISLDDIDELSKDKPVLLFKHSTRCSISFMAKGQLDKNSEFSEEEITPYYLDLLSYRSLSNEIAERYGVTHASPQVLLIKNGKCIYNTSHSDISVKSIGENL